MLVRIFSVPKRASVLCQARQEFLSVLITVFTNLGLAKVVVQRYPRLPNSMHQNRECWKHQIFSLLHQFLNPAGYEL